MLRDARAHEDLFPQLFSGAARGSVRERKMRVSHSGAEVRRECDVLSPLLSKVPVVSGFRIREQEVEAEPPVSEELLQQSRMAVRWLGLSFRDWCGGDGSGKRISV